MIGAATNSGVDLDGDDFEPGSGAAETRIAGNYIGLAANGLAIVGNGWAGVQVGGDTATTIGGPDPEEANRIHGGLFGVFSSLSGIAAKDLVVQGNLIGRNLANTATKSPPSISITLESPGLTIASESPQLLENTIGGGIVAIELIGPGGEVRHNTILGSRVGCGSPVSTDRSAARSPATRSKTPSGPRS